MSFLWWIATGTEKWLSSKSLSEILKPSVFEILSGYSILKFLFDDLISSYSN